MPPSTNINLYSLLDAARIFGEIETAQTLQPNFLNLYMGQSEELLSSVAPYLFECEKESEFGKWLLEKGWGNAWGLYVEADGTLEELRKHFRKFLLVKTEDGKELYFRFYDPRVLRIFLPTCDVEQLQELFGPVNAYITESEDGCMAHVFTFKEGKLQQVDVTKEEFWSKEFSYEKNKTNKEIKTQNQNETHAKGGWSFLVE
jgi:hypothetical protein